MKKETKNNKTKRRELFEVLNDVKTVFEENNKSIPENKVETIETLFSEAITNKKEIDSESKIGNIFAIIFFLFVVFIGYLFVKDYETISNDNLQKSEIIRNLESNNKVLNLYVRGEKYKNDSIKDTVVSYNPAFDAKGNVLTYSEMKKSNDSLRFLYYDKDSEIRNLKFRLDWINQVYGIIIIKKKDRLYITAPKVDSALMLYPTYKSKLQLIEKHYGISINIKNNRWDFNAPKVDSALILYIYFKDRMKYNKEKKSWVITTTK